MLVDSHCHLDFPDFAPEREAVIARAAAAGVGTMLTIGTSLEKAGQVIAIAERDPRIWASVGIHPEELDEGARVDGAELARLAAHPRVIGLGETGLDYHREGHLKGAQAESFRMHIALSRETGLPVIIHSRDADADMIAILREEMGKGPFKALLHCFTSGLELAQAALDLGLMISFSGIVTFKNAHLVKQAALLTPLDRLLVETDAPFLAPMPFRGKRNEPAFVVHTARHVAQLKGVAEDVLMRQTTDNFFRLFAKASRPQDLAA
ncbi:TatD family hydrolase [Zavarzinia sp. CC-PAN008]|uniref:TatD family hydrolase n=1 Tax=Zavarzinia sp. CC-PAN008 TaxID=3243332 RepID=UPI003F74903B